MKIYGKERCLKRYTTGDDNICAAAGKIKGCCLVRIFFDNSSTPNSFIMIHNFFNYTREIPEDLWSSRKEILYRTVLSLVLTRTVLLHVPNIRLTFLRTFIITQTGLKILKSELNVLREIIIAFNIC